MAIDAIATTICIATTSDVTGARVIVATHTITAICAIIATCSLFQHVFIETRIKQFRSIFLVLRPWVAMAPPLCVICREAGKCRWCPCIGPWYCSKECQAIHWPEHRAFCAFRQVGQELRRMQQGSLPEDIVAIILYQFVGKLSLKVTEDDTCCK